MAILVNGILGGFRGKVGNVVGYQHKNRYCIRQLPHGPGKEPSPAQVAHRMKFRRVMAFLQPLRPLLKLLPDKGRHRTSAFNYVFGAILKGAVKGSYPAFDINFPALQLSWGSLSPGWCHQVRVERKRLVFSACLRKEDAERGLLVVLTMIIGGIVSLLLSVIAYFIKQLHTDFRKVEMDVSEVKMTTQLIKTEFKSGNELLNQRVGFIEADGAS